MKTALIKSTLREIKSSFGRFISIALMISLGTFAYVGLKSAGPDMKHTLNEFSKETNMSHLVVQFTTGIKEEDQELILEYDEISDAEFLKVIELKTEKDDKLINLIELPKKISIPKILEGRLPINSGELLLDNSLNTKFNIGDKIVFKKEEKTLIFDLEDTSFKNDEEKISKKNSKKIEEKEERRLNTYEFEVVGFCIVPEYLGELDKGRSFSKYGDFYSFAYISKENFNNIKDKEENNKAQIAYLRFKNIEKMNTLDLGFEKRSVRHKEYFENKFKDKPDELFNEINDNILEELAKKEREINDVKKELKDAEKKITKGKIKIIEGLEEYNDGKIKYNKEIKEAENELTKAKNKIIEGEKEYNKAKKDLDDAKSKYNQGFIEYNNGLEEYNQSKQELEQAERNLNLLKQNKEQLLNLKTLVQNEINLKTIIDIYNNLVEQRDLKIIAKNQALAEGNTTLANQIQLEIDELNSQILALGNIENIKVQYNTIQTVKNSLDSYQKNIYNLEYNAIKQGNQSYIQNLIDNIPIQETQIAQGKITLQQTKLLLDNTKKELDNAKKEIDNGIVLLNKSKKELDKGKLELEESTKLFNIEKKKGLDALNSSYKKLKQAEYDIKINEENFLKEKRKVEKEIKDAEEKINKVKEDIKKIDKPLCIFSTRYDNINYYLFYDSANRINLLANVFPPFLFLIALLVSLTTMTRMVDEQRQQIGTYKGLGYKNREIAFKYIVYGGLAAVLRWNYRCSIWFKCFI